MGECDFVDEMLLADDNVDSYDSFNEMGQNRGVSVPAFHELVRQLPAPVAMKKEARKDAPEIADEAREVLGDKFWVRATVKIKGKEIDVLSEDNNVEVVGFDPRTPPCHAEGSVRYTHNLLNYESLQIHVGATIPCHKPELETVQYGIVVNASKQIEKLLPILLKRYGGKRG